MAGSSDIPTPPDSTIDVIYEDGVLKPLVPLELEAGARIRLQLIPGSHLEQAPPPPPRRAWLVGFTRSELLLLGFGLLVYVLTRAIGLAHFPIYFFSDEAVNPLLAEQLLRNGLRDSSGVFLPPYFQNDDRWTLSLSVYAQLIGVALFGKSVLVTRGVSALISVLCPLTVALTLKLVFKLRTWWLSVLVVAALPAWFLHSRTGFETVLAVSFYACFVCAYLLYRCVAPRYLPLALICGAATFYSYANGQGVMLAIGVLLLIIDIRYHLRQPWRVLLGAALLLALLLVPYVRFRMLHPEAVAYHLRTLDSYWLKPLPLSQKLAMFGQTYLQGLSPLYWFLPNNVDLVRHQMKGMGHLSVLALPFALLGVGVCLWRWRSPAHRVVLAATLAAPFSAALVAVLIPRVLFMVVPAALLMSLGLEQVVAWLRQPRRQAIFTYGSAAIVCVLSFTMLRSALTDGPTWFSDYGLYGMQYGAEQVFSAVAADLAADPTTRVIMSPDWANNPNALANFFLSDTQRQRFVFRDINYYLSKRREIATEELFVLPANEQQEALKSGKLTLFEPAQIVPYPDGQPGFYILRMRYGENADAVFADEADARKILKQQTISLDGQDVDVRFSDIDIGQPIDLFDGRPETLMRGREANPFVIELHFPTARQLSGFTLRTAKMNLGVRVELRAEENDAPRVYAASYPERTDEAVTDFPFPDGAQPVRILRLEFSDLNPSEDVHIHLRELVLR